MKVVADSNSVIYLTKCGLILPLFDLVDLILPEQVVQECLNKQNLPDARYIKKLLNDQHVPIIRLKDEPLLADFKLGLGERAVIRLFHEIQADCILTDDGNAIKWCKKEKIPFFSSPFVPVRLCKEGIISLEDAHRAIRYLGEIGYFSERLLDHARNRLFS